MPTTGNRTLVPRADRVTINHEFASVDEFIHEYVTNLSTTGAFIRSRAPLPVGTKVRLRFTVLEELETITGTGEVVRVETHPRGMGVVFTSLESHSEQLVAKLITRRRAPRARKVVRAATGRSAPPPPPPARDKKP